MNIELTPSKLNGNIEAIASKSDAHRALICAAFADKPCTIKLSTTSNDIEATINVLEAFGASFEKQQNTLLVFPRKSRSLDCTADCKESGSTLRFLLPVAAAIGGKIVFEGSGRLPERPITELCATLKANGALLTQTSTKYLPLKIEQKLNSTDFSLPGNVSSQYISGLLFASAVLGGGTINLTSPLESASYVDITRSVLKTFGIKTIYRENSFTVEKGQFFVSPQTYTVEGDWSCSAFWLCSNFMGSNIKVNGLNCSSPQGDKAVVEILNQFAKDSECYIDCSDIPDLVPPLAIAACARKNVTHFINASRLRLKESDRIETVSELVINLGGKTSTTEDALSIFGTGSLKGGKILSHNDHRIVMSAAIASTIAENPIIIEGAEAVQKSYPSFFKDFNKLGGKSNVINVR